MLRGVEQADLRDPALVASLLPLAQLLNRRYFKLRVEAPSELLRGPVLYVGNHNGGIAGPDLCCTMGSLWETRGPEAPLYALAHDFVMREPSRFRSFLQRLGALRATPENARWALERGGQLLVYPGGDLDAYRHSRKRNEFVLGSRSGFVRIAQESGVPIVPIVAEGAHRSAYIFAEGKRLARVMRLKHWARLERFPVALALPWGVALGPWVPYMPLPFPIQLRFLPPIEAPKHVSPHVVREEVRAQMQRAMDELVARAREGSASSP